MHFARFCALALSVVFLSSPWQAVAQQTSPETDQRPASDRSDDGLLSPSALDALVAGIALYPDETVEQALAASFDPEALRTAAELSPEQFQRQATQFDNSLQYLYANEPALLDQMNEHLTLTARLGVAAQTQLEDVWAAVDRVREQYAAAEHPTDGSAGDEEAEGSSTGAVYPGGAFAAGLVAGNVWQEIYHGYPYYVHYPHATSYVGPNGTVVTGGGQGAVYQNGNTTVGGKSGTVAVYGPNGTTGVAHGQAVGGATTNGNTTTFGSAASGSAGTSNGLYAAGAHQGSGQVSTNPDGSTSFDRNATSGVTSNYGSTVVDHSGSGTYTGQGTGSYNGSTDVSSTHGDASISTSAGAGQASTTVTTQNNQQTFTAGDQQVGSTSASRTSRPEGMKSGSNKWVNSLGATERQRLSSQTWGQMDRKAQSSFTGRNAQPVNQRETKRPTSGQSGLGSSTARPDRSNLRADSFGNQPGVTQRNIGGTSGYNRNTVNSTRQIPSVNRSSPGSNRSRSGGGRGRR